MIFDSVSPDDNPRRSPVKKETISQHNMVIKQVKKRGSDASNHPQVLSRKRNSLLIPLNQYSDGTKQIHSDGSDSEGSHVERSREKKITLPRKSLKGDISTPVKDINEIAIGNVSDSDGDPNPQKFKTTNLVDNGKIVGKNKNAKERIQGSSGVGAKRVLVDAEEDAKKNNTSDEDDDEFDTPPPTIKIAKKQPNGSTINLVIGGAKDQGKPL